MSADAEMVETTWRWRPKGSTTCSTGPLTDVGGAGMPAACDVGQERSPVLPSTPSQESPSREAGRKMTAFERTREAEERDPIHRTSMAVTRALESAASALHDLTMIAREYEERVPSPAKAVEPESPGVEAALSELVTRLESANAEVDCFNVAEALRIARALKNDLEKRP